MESKYNSIKRLIEFWETYEDETDQQDFLEFADWLVIKLREKPELNFKLSKKRNKKEETENVVLFKSMNEPARFLEYTSRISRLHDFYIKKFFSELTINNRLEYLFLYSVNAKLVAKKTELINIHMVDYTTGMDLIKRLINNGLLVEMPDEADKRAKLLTITDAGKHILEQSDKKIADEIQMFLACISMNKWKKILNVLEEINDFHTEIYQVHNEKSPAELLNLMDSLKYLYR